MIITREYVEQRERLEELEEQERRDNKAHGICFVVIREGEGIASVLSTEADAWDDVGHLEYEDRMYDDKNKYSVVQRNRKDSDVQKFLIELQAHHEEFQNQKKLGKK